MSKDTEEFVSTTAATDKPLCDHPVVAHDNDDPVVNCTFCGGGDFFEDPNGIERCSYCKRDTEDCHCTECEPRAPVSLLPMSEAPRDVVILVKLKDDLSPYQGNLDDSWPRRWQGRWATVKHEGFTRGGYDMGWSIALPVGHGGLADEWFDGWMPLPASPQTSGDRKELQHPQASVETNSSRLSALQEQNDRLNADRDAFFERCMNLLGGRCNENHGKMGLNEFVAKGGDACPICLQEQNERYRQALEPFAAEANLRDEEGLAGKSGGVLIPVKLEDLRRARSALSEKEG